MTTLQRSSQPVAEKTLWLIAAVAIVLYFVLGYLVTVHALTPLDDAIATATFGHGGDLVAWTLTETGFIQVFGSLLLLQLITALIARDRLYLNRVIFSIVTILCAWQISDLFKELFHRARPDQWLVRHETSFSYSSGHATNAVAYWVLWAYFLWSSDLPLTVRRAGVALLVVLALAVGWSRLELGAHYVSDVIGGYLLGIAVTSALLALAQRLRVRLFSTA